MNRETVGIIIAQPTNFDVLSFKYFLLALNKVQDYYEFIFPDIEDIEFSALEKSYEQLFEEFETIKNKLEIETNYWIVILSEGLPNNYFFNSQGNVSFITTNVWNRLFSPPSLFEYLLHCITASLLFMHPKLSLSSHNETKGCVIDFTRIKEDDRVDIALGYICDLDRQHIVENIGKDYLKQIELIINRKWIGSIEDRGSIAYNLKHFFHFNIDHDSGFNKTFWEKALSKFEDLPLELIKLIIQGIIAILLTVILLKLGLNQ